MASKVDTLDGGNIFKEYFISVCYFYLSNLRINCTVISAKSDTKQKRVRMS